MTSKKNKISFLLDYGSKVFDSKSNFDEWLNDTNIALGGVKPISLLDTLKGIEVIKTELSRIEYGVLS